MRRLDLARGLDLDPIESDASIKIPTRFHVLSKLEIVYALVFTALSNRLEKIPSTGSPTIKVL